LQSMADAGRVVPALDDAPNIVGFEWLWEAFHQLATERVNGFSVGVIPWSSVQYWAQVNRLSEDETYVLHEVIRHLDQIFIDHVNRSKPSAQQPQRPNSSRLSKR
jgi:hypothetical protein